MNGIPPLVLNEARKIKDLDFERLVIFNPACTEIIETCDGHDRGIPVPDHIRPKLEGNTTLHNHPAIETEEGMLTTAVPSIGDIIGAVWFMVPRLYVCDRDKITETIMPNICEERVQALRFYDFASSFTNIRMSVEGTIKLFSDLGVDFRLLDINTLEPRNDVMTRENKSLEL